MAQSDNEYFPWDFNDPLRIQNDCELIDINKFKDMVNKLRSMTHCVASLFQANVISKELCWQGEVSNQSFIKITGIEFTEVDGCHVVLQNGLEVDSLYEGASTDISIVGDCLTISFVNSDESPLTIGVDSPCRVKATIPYKVAPKDCVDCFPDQTTSSNCSC